MVDRLLEDAELRRLLGRQAREWVQDRLDMEDSLDRYASLYRELADQKTGLGSKRSDAAERNESAPEG